MPNRDGRRVVRRDLVAPGAAEGVLGQRHELDVGEARRDHVVDELVGQLAVGQALPPRAGVHLVDAHRPLVPAGGRPARRASASSAHSCADSVTTEALSGGTSVAKASGSDFSRQVPSAPSTW